MRMSSPGSPLSSGGSLPKLVRCFRKKSLFHCEPAQQPCWTPSEAPELHPDPTLLFLPRAAFSLQGCCLWEMPQPCACPAGKASAAAMVDDSLLLAQPGSSSVCELGQDLPALAQLLRPSSVPGGGHCAVTKVTLACSQKRQ